MPLLLRLATLATFVAGASLTVAHAADMPRKAAPASVPATSGAYELSLLYTGEAWDNVSGGLKIGPSYMYNIDGRFTVDTEKAFGLKGGQFYAEAFYNNAVSTTESFVGAIASISPIDTGADAPMGRLYQLYYDQNFGKTDIRFGIYDLESEFGSTKPMSLFLGTNLTWNTAFDQSGLIPSNVPVGPGNFPYTPLALRLRQDLGGNLSLQFVVADGVADNPNDLTDPVDVVFAKKYGALMIGEADYTPDKHTKIMLGAWHLTSQLPVWGEFEADGSQKMIWGQSGAYLGATARLYSPGGRRGLDAFFTYGISTPQSTNVERSLNVGFTYTGLLETRPDDKFGAVVNFNRANSGWQIMMAQQGEPIGETETSFEVTYRAKINDYVTVQPNVQYVVHPAYAFSSTTKDALVVGVHFEFGKVFSW